MSENLSLNRLFGLLRSDVIGRYRTMLIASGAIAGAMVILTLLFQLDASTTENAYSILAALMLFIAGPIAASQSFRELHDKTRNGPYLILPASALEKMIARLLLITVFFVVYTLVFLTVLSWFTAGLQVLTVGRFGSAFAPALFLRADVLGSFLVNQSLYFLGAAWFRRQHFLKTFFALSLLGIVLMIFFGVTVRVFFPDIGNMNFNIEPETWFSFVDRSFVLGFLKFLNFAALPALCWFIAWLRIRETQVSYGV